MAVDPNRHVSEYLANERTYLAYLRTSLSLLSLGISINRFSLYLLEKEKIAPTSSTGITLNGAEDLGIGMAIVGLVLLVWGTLHYTLIFRQIGLQKFHPSLATVWILSGIILVAAIAGLTLLFQR